MPAVFAVVVGVLLEIMASTVGRVLLALGMGFVTFSGTNVAITFLENAIKDSISTMPAQIVSFLAWCWVDKAISLMFSTYAVCMAFKLAGSTVMRKIVQKG